jgi:hypothetical protein
LLHPHQAQTLVGAASAGKPVGSVMSPLPPAGQPVSPLGLPEQFGVLDAQRHPARAVRDSGLTAELRELGIHHTPPNWGGVWDAIRVQASDALRGLRNELSSAIHALP